MGVDRDGLYGRVAEFHGFAPEWFIEHLGVARLHPCSSGWARLASTRSTSAHGNYTRSSRRSRLGGSRYPHDLDGHTCNRVLCHFWCSISRISNAPHMESRSRPALTRILALFIFLSPDGRLIRRPMLLLRSILHTRMYQGLNLNSPNMALTRAQPGRG